MDFSYLLGQARLESSLDPGAKAATSSAAGLYQFTTSTWLATLGKHGAEHGLSWTQSGEASRGQILALRYNPDAAALMAAELASDNRDALVTTLGREPDAAELYMAHFLGAQGAGKFLDALAADPSKSAAALLPKAAEANRGVFYDSSGAARSLGQVMELMREKMNAAMGSALSPSEEGFGERGLSGLAWVPTNKPLSSTFSALGERENGRSSMASTLAATFGSTSKAMPTAVRSAYGKLRAFGL